MLIFKPEIGIFKVTSEEVHPFTAFFSKPQFFSSPEIVTIAVGGGLKLEFRTYPRERREL